MRRGGKQHGSGSREYSQGYWERNIFLVDVRVDARTPAKLIPFNGINSTWRCRNSTG
jgi:hypothetical protein